MWEKDGEQKLFFAVETKGKNILRELSLTEQLKIQCGEQHFKDLATGVEMLAPVKDFDAMEKKIGKVEELLRDDEGD